MDNLCPPSKFINKWRNSTLKESAAVTGALHCDDLCELLISHARAAFDIVRGDPLQSDAQAVLRWIVATGKATFRQN